MFDQKEYMKKYGSKYYSRPDIIKRRKLYMKEYKQRPEVKERGRIWNRNYMRKYIKKPEVNQRRKEYEREYAKQPEVKLRHKIIMKSYRTKNKDKLNKAANIYRKKKIKTNINFRIRLNLKGRISGALKINSKSKHTMELIGCSVPELKQHLEKQFILGMNWKNYGYGWHIDHIIPCVSFDLSKPREQKKCFNYTNLQPLWASENLSKGVKI